MMMIISVHIYMGSHDIINIPKSCILLLSIYYILYINNHICVNHKLHIYELKNIWIELKLQIIYIIINIIYIF